MSEREEAFSRLELRRKFPTIDFNWFLEIIDLVGLENHEELLEELAKEEEEAIAKEKRKTKETAVHIERLLKSEPHRSIAIEVPTGIDLEHAQAIIAYGFTDLGRKRVFAGVNYLPLRHVRSNVEWKLRKRFRGDLFDGAAAHLLRHGVVIVHGKPGDLRSLNVDEDAKGVTSYGREIIRTIKQFLFLKQNGGR